MSGQGAEHWGGGTEYWASLSSGPSHLGQRNSQWDRRAGYQCRKCLQESPAMAPARSLVPQGWSHSTLYPGNLRLTVAQGASREISILHLRSDS